jgi:glutamate 5-kinase
LTAYSSEDAKRICGRKTAEIEALLGYRGRDEIVHRDDLVVARPRGPGQGGGTR